MPDTPIKYKNPPIIEALCELHYQRSTFSESEQENLRTIWSPAYPNHRFVPNQAVQIEVSPQGVSVGEQELGKRLICQSQAGENLAQIAGNFIVVNRLARYPGWNEFFKQTILERASEVENVCGQPMMRRVGLRYINRIAVPQVPFRWHEWFAIPLPIPPEPRTINEGFQIQLLRRIDDVHRMVIKLAEAKPSPPGITYIIIDLDLIWEGPAIHLNDLSETLERLHSPHRLAFEAYLTDKLRNLFD